MRAILKEGKYIEIISEPYSKLYSGRRRRFVTGKCYCGNEIEMIYSPKANDYPKTCGCSKLVFKDREKTVKIRSSYRAMITRCSDTTHRAYRYYGAKGISVCERWLNGFEYFYQDMADTWFLGAQIDRFPNTKGNYEPCNCRWATATQQARNKDSVKLNEADVLFIRKSDLRQQELADMFGVRNGTISRIKNNLRWKL